MAFAIRLPFLRSENNEVVVVESPFAHELAMKEQQDNWGERVAAAKAKAESKGYRKMHASGLKLLTGPLKNATPAQLVEWAEET